MRTKSNPTTLSVDEQIKEIYWTFRNENENKEMIKSLIRQVCEEVIGQNEPRIPSETNNLQSKKRRIRNAIKDEQRTKLNKILGSDK